MTELNKEFLTSELKKNQLLQLKVFGIVQGVGFRPAVYRSALKRGLVGEISNRGSHVLLELQGESQELHDFLHSYQSELPEFAVVDHHQVTWRNDSISFSTLTIVESQAQKEFNIPIPPDAVTCHKCLEEFLNPNDRRYLYPFTCCTDCGPRWSIAEKMPYDRSNTSMREFTLCADCRSEYNNPLDRRFHAQNICCPQCGPTINVLAVSGRKSSLEETIRALQSGKIIALKGIGGYQLICDARNTLAIAKLRERKQRPHQSLAVMAKSCSILSEDSKTMSLLQAASGPIVLIEKTYGLPMELIAPDTDRLGVFLPTTPLHHLLFQAGFDFLVVTSGNLHGEPMLIDNAEAHVELAEVADYFIHNDRKILRSIDDSVLSDFPIRKARGFTSESIELECEFPTMLALGGDLKNRFCLFKGKRAYFSPHNGNLSHTKTYQHFVQAVDDFLNFYQVSPEVIVVDKHPNYIVSEFGRKLAKEQGVQLIEVQHHLAHAAASMFEQKISQASCVVFDGSGYGEDGKLWGGECFALNLERASYFRTFHCSATTLIGGTRAIKQPSLQALSRCLDLGVAVPSHLSEPDIEQNYPALKKIAPQSTSIGRLFDSVAALLLPQYSSISYEAQAAIGLEKLAREFRGEAKAYVLSWEGNIFLGDELFYQVYQDHQQEVAIERIAFQFHLSIAKLVEEMLQLTEAEYSGGAQCISGGVFQNLLLRELLPESILRPQKIPVNDGGIALGQGIIAMQKWEVGNTD